MIPEKDICHAQGYCNQPSGEKKLCLEKEHFPVAACVSEIIIPEFCEVDFTPDVDTCKCCESEQCK